MTEEKKKTIVIEGTGGVTLGGSGSPEFISPTTSTSTEVTPSLPPEKAPGHYKSSIYWDQQYYGDRKHEARKAAMQRHLFIHESPEVALQKASEITGLDFTLTEQVAFHGLSVLLHKTNYQGHLTEPVNSSLFGNTKAIGIIATWPEIFEACGLKRNKAGKYAGREADDLKQAVLEGLTKQRSIFLKQTVWKGKEKRSHMLAGDIQPISVIRNYQAITEEESLQVEQGAKLSSKIHSMLILFHPLALLEIENFYSLIPVDLYQDIKSQGYKGRTVPLFIRNLLRSDKLEMKYYLSTLAQIVRLDKYLEHRKETGSGRQVTRVREELEKGINYGLKENYILNYSFSPMSPPQFGLYIFKLNPEKCLRAAGRQKRIEASQKLLEDKTEEKKK